MRIEIHSGCIVKLTKDSVLITRNGTDIPIDDSAAPIRTKDGQSSRIWAVASPWMILAAVCPRLAISKTYQWII